MRTKSEKKAVPHTRGEHGWAANIRKWAVLVGDIDDAPTIEAEPVVHCRDCIMKDPPEEFGDLTCHILGIPMKDDDFCSYGERKEDG